MAITDEYFEAISTGDLNQLQEMLKNAAEIGLDVNYTDSNGFNAYAVAINEGFEVIVRILLIHKVKLGDALLYAVENGLPNVVDFICNYARSLQSKERMKIIECHCTSDMFPAYVTPIILASHNNNFKIVQLLYANGARVPDPEIDFEKFTAPPGTLERSTETLSIYTALASDAYISVASINPIESSFDLAVKLRDLSNRVEEFRNELLHLSSQVEGYAGKILAKARNTEEILYTITYTEGQSVEPHLCELALVQHAVRGEHKEFVAHPNCQNVVIGQFFRHLIWLRDYSSFMQILFNILVAVAFPVLSAVFILFPTKAIVRTLRVPYIKFFMDIGSEIAFLAILIIDSLYLDSHKTTNIILKVLITLWLFGKILVDITRLLENSRDFFGKDLSKSVYNFTFFVMLLSVLSLEFTAFLREDISASNKNPTRVIREAPENTTFLSAGVPELRQHVLNSLDITEESINSNFEEDLDRFLVDLMDKLSCDLDDRVQEDDIVRPMRCQEHELFPVDSSHPLLVAATLYSLVIVLAILRLSSIIVLNDEIGPLQISLGGMSKDIAIFGCIFTVVWLAFAIGINQLMAPFQEIEHALCQAENDDGSCTKGAFITIFDSMANLYWTLYGFNAFRIAHINVGNFAMTELLSLVLFGLYNVVALVILINALVAMMTNTYCRVEENADVEWKFSRTATWMTYMSFDIRLPPPFNLFPSVWLFCNDEAVKTREKSQIRVDYFRKQYKRVINTLVERFVHDSNIEEDSAEAGISKKDLTSLKTDILTLRYDCGQMLKGLSVRMDGALDFTNLTNTRLDVAHGIDEKVQDLQSAVNNQKENYQLIYEELKEMSARQPPPQPRMAPSKPSKKGTRVLNMASLISEAMYSGRLKTEAKDIFHAAENDDN